MRRLLLPPRRCFSHTVATVPALCRGCTGPLRSKCIRPFRRSMLWPCGPLATSTRFHGSFHGRSWLNLHNHPHFMLLDAVLRSLFVGVKIDVNSVVLDVLIAGVLCYVRNAIDQYQAAQRDYIGVDRYSAASCGNCARISDTIAEARSEEHTS